MLDGHRFSTLVKPDAGPKEYKLDPNDSSKGGSVTTSSRLAVAASLAAAVAVAQAQGVAVPTRGQLLYSTHCIECHNSQLHWRDRKLATNWESLKAQVRHWQALAFLNWSDADIVEVARHLNETIYRYPATSDQVGRAQPR